MFGQIIEFHSPTIPIIHNILNIALLEKSIANA